MALLTAERAHGHGESDQRLPALRAVQDRCRRPSRALGWRGRGARVGLSEAQGRPGGSRRTRLAHSRGSPTTEPSDGLGHVDLARRLLVRVQVARRTLKKAAFEPSFSRCQRRSDRLWRACLFCVANPGGSPRRVGTDAARNRPEAVGRDQAHETFMRQALEAARTALHIGEVPVGAVVTLGKEVIATGFNQPIPQPRSHVARRDRRPADGGQTARQTTV